MTFTPNVDLMNERKKQFNTAITEAIKEETKEPTGQSTHSVRRKRPSRVRVVDHKKAGSRTAKLHSIASTSGEGSRLYEAADKTAAGGKRVTGKSKELSKDEKMKDVKLSEEPNFLEAVRQQSGSQTAEKKSRVHSNDKSHAISTPGLDLLSKRSDATPLKKKRPSDMQADRPSPYQPSAQTGEFGHGSYQKAQRSHRQHATATSVSPRGSTKKNQDISQFLEQSKSTAERAGAGPAMDTRQSGKDGLATASQALEPKRLPPEERPGPAHPQARHREGLGVRLPCPRR
jgi:hypothetical protein